MRSLIWAFMIFTLLSSSVSAKECVILLHGLARTEHSMSKIDEALQEASYLTVNHSYPSRKLSIERMAEEEITSALTHCPKRGKIHFVTHSLGGILVRQYLKNHQIDRLGRVVMLGPPNKGSEVVDHLKDYPGFKLINGPAGIQLGTDTASLPLQIGPANFELGIIAGTKSINMVLSTLLPQPNDGKVSVKSTQLEGMQDHISLPVTHTFMMRDNRVIHQTLYFIKQGKFERSNSRPGNS